MRLRQPRCAGRCTSAVIVGFIVGRDATRRTEPGRLWLLLGGACLLLFFAIRLGGGYGNAYPYSSVTSLDFWFFAKYPPDPPFLAWSFAATFLGLAVLSRLPRDDTPLLLRPVRDLRAGAFLFLRGALYVLGVAAAILRTRSGPFETYVVWLLLLAAMVWPCAWYYGKKRDRPNLVTRYL